MTNSSSFQYDATIPYDSNQEYDAYTPTSTDIVSPVLAHLSTNIGLNPDGTFIFVLQDTTDEIVQSVGMIVGTVQGERPVVPTFGIPDQTFTQPSSTAIMSAVSEWEPRASVSVVVNTDDQSGVSAVQVNVTPRNKGIGVFA